MPSLLCFFFFLLFLFYLTLPIFLTVHGGDYKTVDGTGVRDFIHVVDLAKGHIAAVKYVLFTHHPSSILLTLLFRKLSSNPGCVAYNLGAGNGTSVLQMLEAMRKASGKPIPHKVMDRRPGDVASCYADPSLVRTTSPLPFSCPILPLCHILLLFVCFSLLRSPSPSPSRGRATHQIRRVTASC